MKLPIEAIKKLLKLILVGGVAGATGGWTIHLLNNVQIGSNNPSANSGGTALNAPITGNNNSPNTSRDVDKSINKTGAVYNFYGGTESIDNSVHLIDQSVTTINNSSTVIYNSATTIREQAKRLSTENSSTSSIGSPALIQQEAARITNQATTINQTLLNISNRASAIRKEASIRLLAQEMQSVFQSPSAQSSSSEEPNPLQLLSQVSTPSSSEDSGGLSIAMSGSDSGGQSRSEAAPEPSLVLGTLSGGFLLGSGALLSRVKRRK
ncbi:MAG: hypothetical protein ACAF41_00970 (plasmid) [Leptolyngbya sp. BL-A-14]